MTKKQLEKYENLVMHRQFFTKEEWDILLTDISALINLSKSGRRIRNREGGEWGFQTLKIYKRDNPQSYMDLLFPWEHTNRRAYYSNLSDRLYERYISTYRAKLNS